MIGLGDTVKDRNGRAWTVTASDSGRWVIAPVDGSSGAERVSASRLAQDFDVADAADPADRADGADGVALANYGARFAAVAQGASPWAGLGAAHAEASAEAARLRSHYDSGD